MYELTYVRGRDQCEVMIDFDENRVVERVYAYWDNLPSIPKVMWLHGKNNLFRYADDHQVAATYVQENFNLVERNKLKQHLENRLKTLRSDIEFWNERYVNQIGRMDRDYVLDQVKVKTAALVELEWALRVLEES